MKSEKKKGQSTVLAIFAVIMIGLGMSDALRGIFSGIFETDLSLSKVQVSWIVTVSYIGNLCFMLFGSRTVDRMNRKKACLMVLAIWFVSMILFAFAGSYLVLLVGMFFAMGSSTLMNTMINILSPVMFGTMAGTMVNVLFFIQGIGTSGSQKVIGTYADSYRDFKLVALGLFVIGLVTFLVLWKTKFPDCEVASGRTTVEAMMSRAEATRANGEAAREAELEEARKETMEESSRANGRGGSEVIVDSKSRCMSSVEKVHHCSKHGLVVLFGLVFGFYFVGEHGIMNWWSMYCQQGLRLSGAVASTSVALFFGGITIGRLVFAPLVGKLGTGKSLKYMGLAGICAYILAICLKTSGIYLMGCAGLFLAIIYPTLVLHLQHYFDSAVIATMTGTIISIGTIFDIVFNSSYGYLVEKIGFRLSILLFPFAMFFFYIILAFSLHKKNY